MKKIVFVFVSVFVSVAFTGCKEWDDHFNEQTIVSDLQDTYQGDVVSYIKSASDLSKMTEILSSYGIFNDAASDKSYTYIVCSDDVLNQYMNEITDSASRHDFALNSVSDMAVAPSMLKDGLGIKTRKEKCVWVYDKGDKFTLDECNIVKTIKANNGYIYYVDGIIPVRYSVYEYLFNHLPSTYSDFRNLLRTRQTQYFDREHSTIVGVDETGRTVYDSVFITRCELMDRYTKDGVEQWNMRDEDYAMTVMVPDNSLIRRAMRAAIDSIPKWLGRQATQADSTKFYDWIVKAAFVDRRMDESEMADGAADFDCVGGYKKVIDEQADETKYKEMEPAHWRPSVQKVDVSKKVVCSNGTVYPCTSFKIPNHVVIYRVKSRLYQVWNADYKKSNLVNPKTGKLYTRDSFFTWNHWINPASDCEGQSSFDLGDASTELSPIYYYLLTAIPDEEARKNKYSCSVTYQGLIYNEDDNTVSIATLPAGEYYWSMGFKHSIQYCLSMKFNDQPWSVEDMCMYAQGSNFHFDRGAASEVPHLGTGVIAYPEGYDPDDWMKIIPSGKAIAYDTDGYLVDIVNLTKSGPFTITIKSNDMSEIFQNQIDLGNTSVIDSNGLIVRTNKNIYQLMMYHWCLRPTKNNY